MGDFQSQDTFVDVCNLRNHRDHSATMSTGTAGGVEGVYTHPLIDQPLPSRLTFERAATQTPNLPSSVYN